MKKPACFRIEYKPGCEFCEKICKHSHECWGKDVTRDEVEEIKYAYAKKIITMKDLCEHGFKAIKNRIKAVDNSLLTQETKGNTIK